MIPTSIRWRLPISYAAIALLAALSLGVVLLTTLRSYYAQQEQDYLLDNADAIGFMMMELGAPNAPYEWLSAHLRSIGFFSQVRIRLFDPNASEIGDSGSPADRSRIAIEYTRDQNGADASWLAYAPLTQEDAQADVMRFLPRIIFERAEAGVESSGVASGEGIFIDAVPARKPFTVPATNTLYGLRLNREAQLATVSRSDQIVRTALQYPGGQLAGYIELSEGPAYGEEIVRGVAQAWAAASAVAIFVAGGVGLFISRRISQPLVALTGVTVRMSDGDLSARAAITGTDEAGILARSFNQMASRVEETIITLRRFVADAAHELHTPLTALRTNLELIGLEERADKRLAYVERAQSQVIRLETLTSDLLELSRIEAGSSKPSNQPTNLTALIHETSELYASQAEQKGIDFALDVPQTNIFIQLDEFKIRRALGNLLENAIKFTPEGGTIRLGIRQIDHWIELWVQDTGIGIPADDLPQLFSRFHRGRNAVAYPGSGLGLAIVKAIAEHHEGQVMAENCSPGARLSLRLPST